MQSTKAADPHNYPGVGDLGTRRPKDEAATHPDGVLVFKRRHIVRAPRREVFEFFSKAENLEKLTPDALAFKILSPTPIAMRAGTLIDYQLRLHGVPFRWRTRIELFEPDNRFVDTQLKGPYDYWHHLHEFTDVPGGTEIKDTVHYRLPFGPLGYLARPFVAASLNSIFHFRAKAINEYFSPSR